MSEEINKNPEPGTPNSEDHFPEDPGLKTAGSTDPGVGSQQQTSIESPEPETINPPAEKAGDKPETENMEVHKHPHHVAHKKKWTEYLLEFLMLFLAVFLGFIAENIREHYIEHQRAKQYAANLVSDLADDTTDLKRANERYLYSVNNIDTFLTLVRNTEFDNIQTGKLYWYGLWSGYNRSFVRNDATFQQMKNSGSLRYINNKTISKKMGQYDALVRKIENQNTEDLPFQLKTRELRSQIFDFRYNDKANRLVLDSSDLKNYALVDSFIKSNPPLISKDKMVINQFAEFCRVRRRIFELLFQYQQQALQIAKELIVELKKEYRLK